MSNDVAAKTISVNPTAVDVEWEHVNKLKFYSLMPMGSFAVRFVVYPIQLVKTRLQVVAQPGMCLMHLFCSKIL
jgi:hypothetical protein